MTWSVETGRRAEKELGRIQSADKARISKAIESMRDDPLSGDTVKLKGQDAFRRRVGNYRIVFDMEYDTQTVRVFAILRRTSTTYR